MLEALAARRERVSCSALGWASVDVQVMKVWGGMDLLCLEEVAGVRGLHLDRLSLLVGGVKVSWRRRGELSPN